jgi:membrane-bound serine protease (ClpP class)
MRTIIKAILASPVPVVSWVAPGGARAASAGTYILYASHVAAMAPGTNLGAATPVQIGMPKQEPEARPPQQPREPRSAKPEAGNDDALSSPSMRKQVNDSAAYIRGLAQMRGRNADWAEQAVRQAVSLSAEEALKKRVIDLVARDLPTLLARMDGRRVLLADREQVLHTKDAVVKEVQPDWRTRLLSVITDPGIALLLMTLGIYGLVFELMSPGVGVPGVLGSICLLLALYALQLLPVNYAGLGLILLGLAFMAAEAFLPAFGVFGIGGVAAFVIGALILIDTELPGYGIPPALILSLGLVSAVLMVATVSIALRTRRRPLSSGRTLPGEVAEVVAAGDGDGEGEGQWVQVDGELWRVHSPERLQPGQRVKIVGRRGLVLDVVPEASQRQGG